MKKYLMGFIVVLMIFITGCSNSNSIEEINYSKLQNMIKNKESFILEVVQTGCSHCEEFSPRFKAILKTNKLKAYSINLYDLSFDDKKSFNDLANISGTPTVLFYKNGKESNNRINGAVSNSQIEEKLRKAGYKISSSN